MNEKPLRGWAYTPPKGNHSGIFTSEKECKIRMCGFANPQPAMEMTKRDDAEIDWMVGQLVKAGWSIGLVS